MLQQSLALLFLTTTLGAVAASLAAEAAETVVACDGSLSSSSSSQLPLTIVSVDESIRAVTFKTNQTNSQQQTPPPVCALYMARSTIPNAGLGIFTGFDLDHGETISWSGIADEDAWFQDMLIPIVDKYKTIPYRGHQRFLSWLGYVWPTQPDEFHHSYHDGTFPQLSPAHFPTPLGLNGADAGLFYYFFAEKDHGERIPINVFAPGMASLVNSHADWINVGLLDIEGVTLNWETGDADDLEVEDPREVAQKSDFTQLSPGSAFVAGRDIEAGSELLIYYGDEWHSRYDVKQSEQDFSHNSKGIPKYETLDTYMEDHQIVYEELLSEMDKRDKKNAMNKKIAPRREKLKQVEEKRRRHVEEVVRQAALAQKDKEPEQYVAPTTDLQANASLRILDSRVDDEDKPVVDQSEDFEEEDEDEDEDDEEPPSRELEWLQEHGACLDNLRAGKSTIPGAGRGAFASRTLPENSIISTAPLLALKRADLVLYETDEETSKILHTLDFNKPIGQELLLNYCYGHPESDLLLVPYSPIVNFINHAIDPSKVNAEIRWPSDQRAQALLKRSPKDWLEAHPLDVTDQSGQLLLEFVATRDIKPGEEIFIDYGHSWKAAWEKHVTNGQQQDVQPFRHEIGVPDGFFPANWLNQLMDYEVEPIESLQPGEIRQLMWKHNGQPVGKNFFVVGLPQNLTKHVYEYADERGIINLYEQLLGDDILGSDEWYVFDSDQHDGPPEQWFAQRYKSVDWNFNMHYIAAWDENARTSVFRAFGQGGYDQVLNATGTYFGLDTLTCFHTSFMGVSEADKSFMHADVYATGEVGYNLIFPIITVEGSKPELDIQSDNGDIVVAVNYQHDRAMVIPDWGYHRTSAAEYEQKGQIRVVMGMYCAQIDETNHKMLNFIYDGEDPAPFMDQFELPIQEIHWSKDGEHRLPR